MVDDHTKMTDDFTEFVEKMVSFFRVPTFCFAVCSRFFLFLARQVNRAERVDWYASMLNEQNNGARKSLMLIQDVRRRVCRGKTGTAKGKGPSIPH